MEDKILEALNNHDGAIFEEYLMYHDEEFPFSVREYYDFVHGIYESADNLKNVGSFFETYLVPVEIKGVDCYLRVMYGQGTSFDLITRETFIINFSDTVNVEL